MALKPIDWIIVVGMIVGATFGLIGYAHSNFISREEKADLKDMIQLLRVDIQRLTDRIDRLPVDRK